MEDLRFLLGGPELEAMYYSYYRDTVNRPLERSVRVVKYDKSIHRWELSTVYLKADEHMLDYISVKSINIRRRSRYNVDQSVFTEVDELTATSFRDELPLCYRIQLKIQHFTCPFEAFTATKELAKRDEVERRRYDGSSKNERP